MATSKELLAVLRLLSKLSAEDKEELVTVLRAQQGSGDSSPPPASSQEKAAG